MADDQLWGKDQSFGGFAAPELGQEKIHRGLAHFLHGLRDHSQWRIHVTCPKRVVETDDRYLLGNGDAFLPDISDNSGGHFHVGDKNRSGGMAERKQLFRALVARFLQKISELQVFLSNADPVVAQCVFKTGQAPPRV